MAAGGIACGKAGATPGRVGPLMCGLCVDGAANSLLASAKASGLSGVGGDKYAAAELLNTLGGSVVHDMGGATGL